MLFPKRQLHLTMQIPMVWAFSISSLAHTHNSPNHPNILSDLEPIPVWKATLTDVNYNLSQHFKLPTKLITLSSILLRVLRLTLQMIQVIGRHIIELNYFLNHSRFILLQQFLFVSSWMIMTLICRESSARKPSWCSRWQLALGI